MDSFEAETLFPNASSNNILDTTGDKNDIEGAWGSSSYAATEDVNSTHFNQTSDEFLAQILGPKQVHQFAANDLTDFRSPTNYLHILAASIIHPEQKSGF